MTTFGQLVNQFLSKACAEKTFGWYFENVFLTNLPEAKKPEEGIFVPTFEENGIFMLGVVFFIQPIFAYRNHSLRRKFFIPHWRYGLPEFKCKKMFYLQLFLEVLGVWKLAKFWTKLRALWRISSYCWYRNENYLCVANYPAQQNRSKLNWG